MIEWLARWFGGETAGPEVDLYAAAVTRARSPRFYADWAVPDTLDGRFEMIVLHVFLVLRHRKDQPELGQAVFDLMFRDMDQSLRELGVSDVVVGNRIKEMARAFYGRVAAYEAGLAEPAALAEALRRNVYGTLETAPAEAVAALGRYLVAVDHAMACDPARAWDTVSP